MACALLTHHLHVLGPLHEQAGVGGAALDEDCGDLVAALLHHLDEGGLVVQRQHDGVAGEGLGHAGG